MPPTRPPPHHPRARASHATLQLKRRKEEKLARPRRQSARIKEAEEKKPRFIRSVVNDHGRVVCKTGPRVKLTIRSLGVLAEDADCTSDGVLVPRYFAAEGTLFGEPLRVWVDGDGKHFAKWGVRQPKLLWAPVTTPEDEATTEHDTCNAVALKLPTFAPAAPKVEDVSKAAAEVAGQPNAEATAGGATAAETTAAALPAQAGEALHADAAVAKPTAPDGGGAAADATVDASAAQPARTTAATATLDAPGATGMDTGADGAVDGRVGDDHGEGAEPDPYEDCAARRAASLAVLCIARERQRRGPTPHTVKEPVTQPAETHMLTPMIAPIAAAQVKSATPMSSGARLGSVKSRSGVRTSGASGGKSHKRAEDSTKPPRAKKRAPGSQYREPKFDENGDEVRCSNCGLRWSLTPIFRVGPDGRKTLCNACGLFYLSKGILRPPQFWTHLKGADTGDDVDTDGDGGPGESAGGEAGASNATTAATGAVAGTSTLAVGDRRGLLPGSMGGFGGVQDVPPGSIEAHAAFALESHVVAQRHGVSQPSHAMPPIASVDVQGLAPAGGVPQGAMGLPDGVREIPGPDPTGTFGGAVSVPIPSAPMHSQHQGSLGMPMTPASLSPAAQELLQQQNIAQYQRQQQAAQQPEQGQHQQQVWTQQQLMQRGQAQLPSQQQHYQQQYQPALMEQRQHQQQQLHQQLPQHQRLPQHQQLHEQQQQQYHQVQPSPPQSQQVFDYHGQHQFQQRLPLGQHQQSLQQPAPAQQPYYGARYAAAGPSQQQMIQERQLQMQQASLAQQLRQQQQLQQAVHQQQPHLPQQPGTEQQQVHGQPRGQPQQYGYLTSPPGFVFKQGPARPPSPPPSPAPSPPPSPPREVSTPLGVTSANAGAAGTVCEPMDTGDEGTGDAGSVHATSLSGVRVVQSNGSGAEPALAKDKVGVEGTQANVVAAGDPISELAATGYCEGGGAGEADARAGADGACAGAMDTAPDTAAAQPAPPKRARVARARNVPYGGDPICQLAATGFYEKLIRGKVAPNVSWDEIQINFTVPANPAAGSAGIAPEDDDDVDWDAMKAEAKRMQDERHERERLQKIKDKENLERRRAEEKALRAKQKAERAEEQRLRAIARKAHMEAERRRKAAEEAERKEREAEAIRLDAEARERKLTEKELKQMERTERHDFEQAKKARVDAGMHSPLLLDNPMSAVPLKGSPSYAAYTEAETDANAWAQNAGKGAHVPERLHVRVKDMQAVFLPGRELGGHSGQSHVRAEPCVITYMGNDVITPSKFEAMGGNINQRWKSSVHANTDVGGRQPLGTPMGALFRKLGDAFGGESIVGKRVEVFSLAERRVKVATITAYVPNSGFHKVEYRVADSVVAAQAIVNAIIDTATDSAAQAVRGVIDGIVDAVVPATGEGEAQQTQAEEQAISEAEAIAREVVDGLVTEVESADIHNGRPGENGELLLALNWCRLLDSPTPAIRLNSAPWEDVSWLVPDVHKLAALAANKTPKHKASGADSRAIHTPAARTPKPPRPPPLTPAEKAEVVTVAAAAKVTAANPPPVGDDGEVLLEKLDGWGIFGYADEAVQHELRAKHTGTWLEDTNFENVDPDALDELLGETSGRRRGKRGRKPKGNDLAMTLADDMRRTPGECILCGEMPSAERPLLDVDGFRVHQECALWSPEVYCEGHKIVGLPDAVLRGSQLRCTRCLDVGATVGCRHPSCNRTFHIGCVISGGGSINTKDFLAACKQHRTEEDIEETKAMLEEAAQAPAADEGAQGALDGSAAGEGVQAAGAADPQVPSAAAPEAAAPGLPSSAQPGGEADAAVAMEVDAQGASAADAITAANGEGAQGAVDAPQGPPEAEHDPTKGIVDDPAAVLRKFQTANPPLAGPICAFCGVPGDAVRPVHQVDGHPVHLECALWAPEVYWSSQGGDDKAPTLAGVAKAVDRCKDFECGICGKPGASMQCRTSKGYDHKGVHRRCQNRYHLLCLLSSGGGVRTEDWTCTCPAHATKTDKERTAVLIGKLDEQLGRAWAPTIADRCRLAAAEFEEKRQKELEQRRQKQLARQSRAAASGAGDDLSDGDEGDGAGRAKRPLDFDDSSDESDDEHESGDEGEGDDDADKDFKPRSGGKRKRSSGARRRSGQRPPRPRASGSRSGARTSGSRKTKAADGEPDRKRARGPRPPKPEKPPYCAACAVGRHTAHDPRDPKCKRHDPNAPATGPPTAKPRARKPKKDAKKDTKDAPPAAADAQAEAEEEEDELEPLPPAPEGAICALCGLGATAGRSMVLVEGHAVHDDCAVWCPQAYYDADNKLVGLASEVKRASRLTCAKCGKPGASIGCLHKACQRSFHLGCVTPAGGLLIPESYTARCQVHVPPSMRKKAEAAKAAAEQEPAVVMDVADDAPKAAADTKSPPAARNRGVTTKRVVATKSKSHRKRK